MDFLQAEIERKAKQLKQNEVTAVSVTHSHWSVKNLLLTRISEY